MAPEQADGLSATPASDVFALGSVLCFAATGGTPFGDGEPAEVLHRVVHAQPALEALPGALRGLVARCLAKDPADRPTLAQVLRTCQVQVPQLGGPSASFWPGQVAALIARYQSGLDDTAQPLEPEGEPGGEPEGEPEGQPTQTIGGSLVVPDRSAPPGSGGASPPADRAAGPVSRRRALAGLATAGLAAAGVAAGGWAYARSGSGRRPAANQQLLWASKTGGPVSSGAALADGILYVGSDDGKVHAFEAASGRPVRTFSTSGAVSGGVAVAGGTLFVGSADHEVHAFRIGTGGKAWAYRTGGPVNCTPTIADGTVYIGSDDGYVYAIDADTGRLAWRYRTGGPVRSQPQLGSQLYSDHVFVGSDDGYLYAIGTDGKFQWRFATSGPVTAGPVYGMGVVVVCDGDGRAFGVWADGTGKVWEGKLGGAVRGTPAFAGETLYIGSAGSAVYALRA